MAASCSLPAKPRACRSELRAHKASHCLCCARLSTTARVLVPLAATAATALNALGGAVVVDALCGQVSMAGVDAHGGATSRLRWHPKPLASPACACPPLVPLAPPQALFWWSRGVTREFRLLSRELRAVLYLDACARLSRAAAFPLCSSFARRMFGAPGASGAASGASLRIRTGAEAEAASAAAMTHVWCVVTGAGTRLLASCGQDHTLRIWDVDF